ncbi:MAG: hypothetical protein R2860_10745 [Desulfobacterales bacterium]
MEKIVMRLSKIFGDGKQGSETFKEGQDKSTIFEKTGMTVGVNNASFQH